VDHRGGDLLASLLSTMKIGGTVAAVGLAADTRLNTTVMPFILRGVSLLGINSSATRRESRLAVWKRIATDLRPRHLERIVTRTIAFDELPGAFAPYLEGAVTGRTVVRIA
jgi:acrylyl-CoA reductase (NADPH)